MNKPEGLIYQNDPRLPLVFQKEGCKARSLMAMAEFSVNKALTVLQVQLCIATALKDDTILAADMSCGKNEGKIIEYAFKLLGFVHSTGVQAGYQDEQGVFHYWNGSPLPKERVSFTNLHWSTDFEAGHWTLGTNGVVELFDSWSTAIGFNPWDESRQTGYTINKKKIDTVYPYVIQVIR